MKRISKKIACVFCAAVLVFSLAACSARSAATSEKFSEQAQKLGFQVSGDGVSSSSANSYQETDATLSDSTDTKVAFMTFPSEATAQNWYSTRKSKIATSGGGDSLDADTYRKYTLTNGELYYVLVLMGDTVIDAETTTSQASQIDSLVKAMNY